MTGDLGADNFCFAGETDNCPNYKFLVVDGGNEL